MGAHAPSSSTPPPLSPKLLLSQGGVEDATVISAEDNRVACRRGSLYLEDLACRWGLQLGGFLTASWVLTLHFLSATPVRISDLPVLRDIAGQSTSYRTPGTLGCTRLGAIPHDDNSRPFTALQKEKQASAAGLQF